MPLDTTYSEVRPVGGREDLGPGVPQPVYDDSASPTLEPQPAGKKIGRYNIQQLLGRGGMGEVYGGIDPLLGRRVAIKVVRWDSSGERQTARLRREGQALARLPHPNIVALYDIGTTRRGAFIAMEFINGKNLRKWLRAEPRSWQDALAVVRKAGRGLAAAHAAGIIHRDFKPTNVMVGPDGLVKVLDFGLAWGSPHTDPWLERSGDDVHWGRLTAVDSVVGTAGYMAPEQLLGEEVTPRSDQFSLCVTLFEALFGYRPFRGKTPVEVAHALQAARDQGVTIPERRTRDSQPVPQHIIDALRRGLSIEPEQRFPTVDAFLDALDPHPPPQSRWWPKAATITTAVVTGGLVAAVAMWLAGGQPAADDAAACEETATAALAGGH